MESNLEVWKDVAIDEYSSYYQVSNFGRIRSKLRMVRNGSGEYELNGVILQPVADSKGYLRVSFCVNRLMKTFKVHRLVALTFIENPLNLPQVNHKDGNKQNNNVENLEWINNSDNQKHAYQKGLIKPKYLHNHHRSNFTENDIALIVKMYLDGDTFRGIAKKLNKDKSVISRNIKRYFEINGEANTGV